MPFAALVIAHLRRAAAEGFAKPKKIWQVATKLDFAPYPSLSTEKANDRPAALAQLDNGELIALIGATARGDRDAFATLYQRTAPKLFAILLRILRGKAAAEDALQDVFLKIWQNARSFSPEAGPPMGWLISVARNRAIDILRARNPAEPGALEATDLFARLADLSDGEAQMSEPLPHCGIALGRLRNRRAIAFCSPIMRAIRARNSRAVSIGRSVPSRPGCTATSRFSKSCLEATT